MGFIFLELLVMPRVALAYLQTPVIVNTYSDRTEYAI